MFIVKRQISFSYQLIRVLYCKIVFRLKELTEVDKLTIYGHLLQYSKFSCEIKF